MTDTDPYASINLQEADARNDNARHIIAGCAAAMPTLTGMWQYVQDALNDARVLAAEITRLAAELERVRLDRANALAAMRAALAAHADGEPDPMWYLRDELDTPQAASAASRRRG